MKVSGFSFIRNALTYDYPIVEAIRSVLPLCDEFVVAVGKSEDDTLGLIRRIDSEKIRIVETVWDDSLREGGQVLALETDKAYAAIAADTDWCFYVQGDEVVHELDHETIRAAMDANCEDTRVEGLLFKYRHFYGSYDYLGDSRNWYKREIRIVRKDDFIRSYKDAQGFRRDGMKLRVREVDAYIHHYGWVKHPEAQQEKQRYFNKLWHNDDWVEEHVPDVDAFDYAKIDSLSRFEGSHPAVMSERIAHMNWQFSFDPMERRLSLKERGSRLIERLTGRRVGEYRNYELLD